MDTDVMRDVEAYLHAEISLSDLRDRLADATWDNPDAPRLAHELEHLIDEAASGHVTKRDLDADLAAVCRKVRHAIA